MEDLIISLQNIADSMETVAESCKKIANRLEQIETRLNNKICVQVDLDKYCLDGKSIKVNGQVNVSNWM
jgi:hypothetical protein